MIDIRKPLLKTLYSVLQGQNMPVYSLVPDDISVSHIYIGEVISNEVEVKGVFQRIGSINVEVFYNMEQGDGSLDDILDRIQDIKRLVLPATSYRLDLSNYGLDMTSWWLEYEESPYRFTDNRRLLTSAMVFGFHIHQYASGPNNLWDVIHGTDDVIFGTDRVIHIN